MDNLSHALVGVIAAEAVVRSTKTSAGGLPDNARRNLLLTMGAVGGNLPDLDLLWSWRGFSSDKLGYLLEHRGYTHTVVGCAALALLLYAAVFAWVRLRRYPLSPGDRWTLGGMAAFCVFLHLGMDALNSYGVHPFWPLYNGWLYGDSVFIVEPLYWIAAAPLFFVLRSRFARIGLGVVLLIAVVASVAMHRAGPAWVAAIVLLTIALVFVGRLRTARTAALTGVAMAVLVTSLFLAAGAAAARRVASIAALEFPGDTSLDQVLSATPTNPLCWDVLLVQTGGGRYVVRHGTLAIGFGFTPDQCQGVFAGLDSTAPMTAVADSTSRDMRWLGEFSMPAGRLASLVRQDCAALELLQFARAPFATEVDRRWVIGDLRFDREAGLGMAEIEVKPRPGSGCRYHVPWIPPRVSLLSVRE